MANDTGILSTDNITASSSINVTGLEAGSSFEYQARIADDLWGDDWAVGTGTSFDATVNTTREYRVRQTDSNGNTGTESSGLSITHDDTAPTTTLSAFDTTLGMGASTSVSITFNENVYGFIGSDVTMVGGGATSTFSGADGDSLYTICLLYTSPSPRDRTRSRMPSSA